MDSDMLVIDTHYAIYITTSIDDLNIVSFRFVIADMDSYPLMVISDPSISSHRKLYTCIDAEGIYYMVSVDQLNGEVFVYEPGTAVYTVMKSPQQIILYD